ncbi:MAG: 2-oxoacid:acceptor oxidoreductase subunit alpha [Fusobacteriota bacterium]
MDLNIVIGGQAGQGLKTITNILTKSFFKMGLHIYTSKDYMSRIRGGHNFMNIRISDEEELFGPMVKEDILLALNEETIEKHSQKLAEDGVILFDGDLKNDRSISLSAKKMAKEAGNPKTVNSVFLGALFKILGVETDVLEKELKSYFEKKGEEVQNANYEAMKKGYEAVDKKYNLKVKSTPDERLIINGNDAIGFGAVSAGVKFYSAYPMTPATGVLTYLAGKQNDLGIVVEQAEDEIAAINMALGASYGGIRAMTGTSGGGYALMNEGVSLAGITETPIVIAEVQRPGPATGLPTRTAQGDLSFVVNSGHGDFPIMVISPRDGEDAFYQTFRAFNIAEKYQMPVIILSDKFLADSTKDFKDFDIDSLKIENSFLKKEDLEEGKEYKRYEITESGISPLAYPGLSEDITVMVDSDEHDEEGHIIEDAETRVKMVDKRSRKIEKLKDEEILEPEYIGEDDIDYLLVCFGSTYGPLREAKNLLNDSKEKFGLLSFSDVYPFPTEKLMELHKKGPEVIVVENNGTGQFAKLMRGETGIKADHMILNYDGRPLNGVNIYNKIKKEVISK